MDYFRKAKEFAQAFSEKFQTGKAGNILVKYDSETRRVIIANVKNREIRTFYIADTLDADPFAAAMKLAADMSSQ